MALFSRTACAGLRQQMSRYNARNLHTNITPTMSIDVPIQKGFIDEWRQIWSELGRDQWMIRHGHIELPSTMYSDKSKRLPGTITSELHGVEKTFQSNESESSLMHLIKNLNKGMPRVYKPSFPEI